MNFTKRVSQLCLILGGLLFSQLNIRVPRSFMILLILCPFICTIIIILHCMSIPQFILILLCKDIYSVASLLLPRAMLQTSFCLSPGKHPLEFLWQKYLGMELLEILGYANIKIYNLMANCGFQSKLQFFLAHQQCNHWNR